MSSNEVKVIGALLECGIKHCRENGVEIDRKKLNLPESIEEEQWYDIKNFYTIVEHLKSEKSLQAVEDYGRNFFHYFNLEDELGSLDNIKDAIAKMYILYQMFIKADRIGIWKAEGITRHAHLVIKENTVVPSEFTIGFLYSLAKTFGRKAVKVKIIEKEDDQPDNLNIYEISWMDQIKKFS